MGNNIIDQSGKIKKSEIIERALASAPVLDKEVIAKKILDYVKKAKDSKYFILNSRLKGIIFKIHTTLMMMAAIFLRSNPEYATKTLPKFCGIRITALFGH